MLADTADVPPIAIYERATSSSRRVKFSSTAWKSSAPKRIMIHAVATSSVRQVAQVEALAVEQHSDRDKDRMVLAQACGTSMFVALACAAASYVPGLSFAAYGGGLALLAASFFGLTAAER